MKLKVYLVGLLFWTVVPMLVFSAVTAFLFHRQTVSATERGLVETARALSVAIDREVTGAVSALKTLATSDSLLHDNLEVFDQRSRSTLAVQPTWENIVLYDAAGQQLVNLRVPFGTPLPVTGNPGQIAEVVATRRPAVSSLFRGRVGRKSVVQVSVPVLRDGHVKYVLGGTFDPGTFTDLLLRQQMPPESIGSLLDRNRIIIARTRGATQYVGQPTPPDLAAKTGEMAEGSFRSSARDGGPVYAAFSRSSLTGWTVALGVPVSVIDAPLRRSLVLLAGLGTLVALLGVAVAGALARRIGRPIRALSEAAPRVASGRPVTIPRSGVTEVDEVARALEVAGTVRRSVEERNGRLLHETMRRRQSAESLAEVGRLISQSLELERVGEAIVTSINRLLETRWASLYRLEEGTGDLVLTAGVGEGVHWVRRFLRGTATLGLAVRDRQPVMTADVLSDPRVELTAEARAQIEASQYRAVLAVPMLVRNEAIGALALADRSGRVFSPEEVRLVQQFSDQATAALENARLHEEIREKLAHSETLLAVSQEVTGTLDATEVMRRVARSAGLALGADMTGVFLADAEQRYLRPIAGYHVPKHLLADFMTFAIPLKGHRFLEEAWERRQPVWSTDVAADPRIDQDTFRRFPHRSNLFYPMIVQGALIGGLFVTWFEQEHRFTPAELQLVEGISRQAGIALANARLVEELKTRHGGLEALLEVTRQLSRIQPVNSLLASIAQACGRLLGTDSVGIRLVEGDELVLAGIFGDAQEIMNKARLKIGESLSGQVAASGEALLVRDLENDPRVIPEHRDPLRRLGYRGWLGVPVRMGDRFVGVLSIRTKRPEGFSAEDQALATAFASQVAVTLENARLYQEVQHALDELSQTQDQLTQAQRMEAVGRLAGGVAHDFNNLLTVITGHSHLLLGQLDPTNPMRPKIELIRATANRAAALTRQLLAFSRKQVLRPSVLDFTSVVTGLTPMLQRLVGEDIEFAILPGSAAGCVLADQGQLEQVLANLVVNARDAMPRGGRLTIRTARVELGAAFVTEHPEVHPGAYVMLAVSDTGTGMSPEIQSRIFEPFFTTKEVGKGTGLGLSTVYGIVRQHEGCIVVESEVGRGTTFRIYLPRVEATAETPEPVRPPADAPRAVETILLVEDEAEVRALARETLTMTGYTVLEAPNGSEALQIAEKEAGHIHLLVADVVMPGLNGREVAERLKGSHPEARVLYISGYADDAIVHHGVLRPGTKLLSKPFAPDGLARTVREVLDAPAIPAGRGR